MPWYRRLAKSLVFLIFAYAIPSLGYSIWAWLRLRPSSWAENEVPPIDPLGMAWQNWRPSASNNEEGTLFAIAAEQGERWQWFFIGAVIAIVIGIAGVVVLRMTRSKSKLPCDRCGYDLLESVRGRVVTCPSCGKDN